MQYALLVTVTALLFIRPSEIVPDVEGEPIYQAAILACLACSFPRVLVQFSAGRLRQSPVTALVLCLWLSAVVSQIVQQYLSEARSIGVEFGKVVLYFLLLVGVVDSYARLRRFVMCLAGLIAVATLLAVLQYHGYLDLPGLRTHVEHSIDADSGEDRAIARLCGSGIFNDPNDLAMALTVCIVFSLYAVRSVCGSLRYLWILPVALCSYALILTQSRGGLMALLVSVLVLAGSRYGARRVLLAGVLGAVPLLILDARQLDFDLSNPKGTGQGRIQLWAEGLNLFRESPLFGIGAGNYQEQVGLVAHNSFVHAFTELGIIGGSLFLATFVYTIGTLHRLRVCNPRLISSESDFLRVCLLAAAAGTAVALLSLSRVYTYPAYVVLALATVYFRVSGEHVSTFILPLSGRFWTRVVLWTGGFLVTAHLFVMLAVRWH